MNSWNLSVFDKYPLFSRDEVIELLVSAAQANKALLTRLDKPRPGVRETL